MNNSEDIGRKKSKGSSSTPVKIDGGGELPGRNG